MDLQLKMQSLALAIVAWIAAGLADARHLPLAEIVLGVTSVVAGLLTLFPRP